jgi:L-gulonate 5-dehydrogenase
MPMRFVRRGLSLLGSLIYDHGVDFARAIELVRVGGAHPSALVSHVEQLEHASSALQLVVSGQSGKVLLDIAGVLEAAA